MLHINNPLVQIIFDQLPEPRIVVKPDSPDFSVVTVNKAFEIATSTTRTDLTGQSVWEAFDERRLIGTGISSLREGLNTASTKRQKLKLPMFCYDLPSTEGQTIMWWGIEILPIIDSEGDIDCLMCTALDITSQVDNHSQRERRQNKGNWPIEQERLTRELDEVKGSLVSSREANIRSSLSLIHTQERVDEVTRSFDEQLKKKTSVLTESEYRLNRMVMNTPIGLTILKGKDLVIEVANLPMLKIWGRTFQQVIGKSLKEVFPELDGQPFPEMLHNVFDTGNTVTMPNIPVTILTTEGICKVIYVDFSYNPLFDLEGTVEAILVSAKETTSFMMAQELLKDQQEELAAINEQLGASNEEIKAANEELSSINQEFELTNLRVSSLNEDLLKSEQRFRRMITEAPVAMMMLLGEDLIIDNINPGMLAIINRDAAVQGKQLFEVMPEIKGQSATDLFFNVLKTGEPAYGKEVPVMLLRNGIMETGYFNFTYTPFTENGQIVGILDVAVEVTDQVNARLQLESIIGEKIKLENTLRASEQRLKSILDTMAEGVGIVDANGQLVYANVMAQKILGLTESEIKDRKYDDPRWQNQRIDGSPLPPEEHPMAIMMKTRLPVYDKEIAVQPPGKERFYVSINAAPIMDEQGNLTGGIGTFMNVTTRRKLMMQKDDFISVASHELKTPVTTLKASLQLLTRLKDNISPAMLTALVSQSNRSLDKLSRLISELLNSNRISQGQLTIHKKTFSISKMISDCCQHIRAAGTHEIIVRGDSDVKIHADEQQLDQVVVNFINNAVKYAPDSREIIIEVAKLTNNVKVAVTDKGPGIEPEKIPYLFDRYYRGNYNSGQFSGLGLGLYISSEIIKKHGGEIGVDSTPGKGSTFWFTIPLYE